ncbi:hypothetical protein [Mycolicibacterium sp. S3B2]|uniref:hypothetical protein n=1 Tax=Mycolicibacterium sp. S3B2 TaxID=3415120 RepID=UPI003C7BFFD8
MLVINFSLPQTEQTLMSWTYASGGGALVQLRGTSGMVYAADRKRAAVRQPRVLPYSGDKPPVPLLSHRRDIKFPNPVEIFTQVLFDGAAAMRWNPNALAGSTEFTFAAAIEGLEFTSISETESAAWSYTHDRHQLGPPPMVTGLNEAVDSEDSRNTFYAGLAFGTAAATLVGAIQNGLGWLASRPRSTRRRRARPLLQRLASRSF